MKKCLIINGSPRLNGNTAQLIDRFVKSYRYECEVVNAFSVGKSKGISSCIDCGLCLQNKFCAMSDDFNKIISNNYDLIVIASPIYQSNLPGPMINIVNRFNFLFNNKRGLGFVPTFKPKDAILILVGGGGACKQLQGETNEDWAVKQSCYIFKKINAKHILRRIL